MTNNAKTTPEATAVDPMAAIGIAYVRTEYYLSRFYEHGEVKHYNAPPLTNTWSMVSTVGGLFDQALRDTRANLRVRLETTTGRKPPNDIRGFIFFSGTTKIVPVKVSPALIRIRRGEIFLDRSGGAKALLDFLRAELESIVKVAA